MASNFGYAGTAVGLMKIIHLLFGIITIGLVAGSFDSEYFHGRFFLGGSVTVYIISLIYFIIHLLSYGASVNRYNKAFDEVYHFLGACILIVGASLWLKETVEFNSEYCTDIPVDPNSKLCGSKFPTKISGGAFGLINGILYLVTVVLRGIEKDEDDELDEPPPVPFKP